MATNGSLAEKVVTDKSVDAYQLLAFRTVLVEEFVKAVAAPSVATCAADAITDQTSVADVTSGRGPSIVQNPAAMQQIGATCRATATGAIPPDQIDH